jgi:acyl-CoA thioesterase-1
MGDSLSAAYGIQLEQGWVNLLQNKLKLEQTGEKTWHIINASVSGETTTGALARLPELLDKHRPQLCIIELGANDGLRGMPLNTMHENLNEMIAQCKQYGQLLLIGMRLPPNYGNKYTEKFRQIFNLVSKNNEIAFLPFLLGGFSKESKYFQADGFHPTAAAQEKILANVWPVLFPLLSKWNLK